jgi:excisionase family DNA binding protein
MSATDDRLLSLEDVADRLQVSDQSVRRWIKAGKLAAYKPGLEWRIKPSDLEEFLQNHSSPKVQAPLPPADAALAERRDIDVVALDKAWAESVSKQREFQLHVLNSKLGRSETEEERKEAYRNFKNWWVLLAQILGTGFMHIPDMPGPALIREGEITAERVREFVRQLYTNETEREAELRSLEEVFGNEAHVGSE